MEPPIIGAKPEQAGSCHCPAYLQVYVRMEREDILSTAEVAALAGVHRDTLLRWLRQGLVPEPGRDWRGWRVFSRFEAEQVVRFARAESSSISDSHRWPQVRNLEEIDWNFPGAVTGYLTHGLHPYPAKFIPQIPNLLVQELSSVGDRVCDIFCGSGTTLVEALTLKRHAVGVDANPLAVLITQAKTTRLQPGDEDVLRILAARARQLGDSLAVLADDSEPLLFDPQPFKSGAPRPSSEEIGQWFDPFIVEELAELLSWCRKLPTPTSRTTALASFSAIVVAVSRQDSDTRYVGRDKGLTPGDAFRKFAGTLERNVNALIELTDLVEPRFTCEVLHKNVLDAPDLGSVGLVVCSPPYPNAYSYHLYHRTRMAWLRMDQEQFKEVEIGSHRKYSRRGKSRVTVKTFRSEMEQVFTWLRRHLRKGGFACFVIGDSVIEGELVDNAELLSRAASGVGFIEAARISRKIDRTRGAFNPSHGKNRKGEHILVLERQ
jgi:DNA modification methylase